MLMDFRKRMQERHLGYNEIREAIRMIKVMNVIKVHVSREFLRSVNLGHEKLQNYLPNPTPST